MRHFLVLTAFLSMFAGAAETRFITSLDALEKLGPDKFIHLAESNLWRNGVFEQAVKLNSSLDTFDKKTELRTPFFISGSFFEAVSALCSTTGTMPDNPSYTSVFCYTKGSVVTIAPDLGGR